MYAWKCLIEICVWYFEILIQDTGGFDPSSRPRFFTTVPSGVYLPPAKDVPVAPKVHNPRTYAYFSIPKIFAQNIDKGDKVNPIEEIHALKTMTTYGKSIKLRYVMFTQH